jgi:hypothetical protein
VGVVRLRLGARYIKSTIPLGRRILWPLRAGGQNLKFLKQIDFHILIG